jgi:hypothetical protein
MKHSSLVGVTAALILIIACFLPWTYHPDLDKTFTGFFSEKNQYGRPGKVFLFFAIVSILLFIIPRIWAKRFNILFTVLAFAFAVKTYMLFTSCYRGICPDKKLGIFLMLISTIIMVISAVLPDMKLKEENKGSK